jgi:hypothetical protein
MKPEPSDSLDLPAVVAVVGRGHLPAEEAVEEILEVVRALPLLLALVLILVLVVVAGLLGHGLDAAMKTAAALACRLLGKGLGVDVHHRRPHLPRNLHKFIGRHGRVDDLEGGGVGAVDLLLLAADPVGGKEPATMAAESVASKTNAEERRRVRSRSRSDFMGLLTSLCGQPGGWVVHRDQLIQQLLYLLCLARAYVGKLDTGTGLALFLMANHARQSQRVALQMQQHLDTSIVPRWNGLIGLDAAAPLPQIKQVTHGLGSLRENANPCRSPIVCALVSAPLHGHALRGLPPLLGILLR